MYSTTEGKNKIYEKIADTCDNDIETLIQCSDDYKTQLTQCPNQVEATWRCFSSILAPDLNRRVVECLKSKKDCKADIDANDKAAMKFWEGKNINIKEGFDGLDQLRNMEQLCWPQLHAVEECAKTATGSPEEHCKQQLTSMIKCFSNAVARDEARNFERCLKDPNNDCSREAEALSFQIYNAGVGKFLKAAGYSQSEVENNQASQHAGTVWTGAEAKLRTYFDK